MKQRVLSMFTALALCLGLFPTWALAAEVDPSLCRHHTEHTQDCGYAAPVEGRRCGHVHTAECYTLGYLPGEEPEQPEGLPETPADGEAPAEEPPQAENLLDCHHVHDEICGFVQEKPGRACGYECRICPIEALLEALPEDLPDAAAEDETAAVRGQVEKILALYDELGKDEQEQVSLSRCLALKEALDAAGAPDPDEPEPEQEPDLVPDSEPEQEPEPGLVPDSEPEQEPEPDLVSDSDPEPDLVPDSDPDTAPDAGANDLCPHGVSECRVCPIAALIKALPDEVTEDNRADVEAQLQEILGLYAALPTQEEADQVDISRCEALQWQLNRDSVPTPAADTTYDGLTFTTSDGNVRIDNTQPVPTHEVFLSGGGSYTISGTWNGKGKITSNYNTPRFPVTIEASDTPYNITLSDVTISNTGAYGGTIIIKSGATVNLTLQGTNTLAAGDYMGGLTVPDGAALTIRGDGTLTASNDKTLGAGIGGGDGNISKKSGTITFESGTIKATGRASGIGSGGSGNSGGTVIINGTAWIEANSIKATTTYTRGIVFEGDNGHVYGSQTLSKSYDLDGKTLDVGADAALTIGYGYDLTGGTITGSGTCRTQNLTADMIQVGSTYYYTGSDLSSTIQNDITVNPAQICGHDFDLDTSVWTGPTVTKVSDLLYRITYTPKSGGTAITKDVTVLQSGTDLSAVKTYNAANQEQDTFIFRNTIRVKATPAATGAAPANTMMRASFTEPAAGEMAVYYGDTQISAPAAASGGVYTMDVNSRDLPVEAIGKPITLTVKFVGNTVMAAAVGSATVTVNPDTLNAANVTLSAASATYNGQAQTPDVTVEAGQSILREGTDYTVTFTPQTVKHADTYSVRIEGKGYYTGTVDKSYEITKAPPTLSWGSNTLETVYNGGAANISATLTLQNSETGTVEYSYAPDGANDFQAGLPTGAGSYTVKAYFNGKNDTTYTNYNEATATAQLTIKNAAQAAPDAPTAAAVTDTSITLTAIEGAEYKMGTGDWQDSPVFEGLNVNQAYTFYVRLKGKENYDPSPDSSAATISTNKTSLENAVVEVTSTHTYNGSVQMPTVTVTLNGKELVNGQDYTVTSTSKDAGEGTAAITGTGNYQGEQEVKFEISKAPITDVTLTGSTSKTYDGTTECDSNDLEITFSGRCGSEDVAVTVGSFVYADSNAGTTTVVAKELSLSGADSKNYELTGGDSVSAEVGEIKKATVGATTPQPLNIANNLASTYTFALSNLRPTITGKWGDVEYAISVNFTETGYYNGDAEIVAGGPSGILNTLSLPILFKDAETTGQVGTVTVTITSTNYEEFTNEIHIMAQNKKRVTFGGVEGVTAVYNGQQVTGYTGTLIATDSDGNTVELTPEIRYTGRVSTSYDDAQTPPVHAGTYFVVFRVPDDNERYIGRTNVAFEITQAEITITAGDQTAMLGDEKPEPKDYTVSGLVGDDELATEPKLTCDADMNTAGTYPITASGAVVPSTDYKPEINYVEGTLTVIDPATHVTGVTLNKTELTLAIGDSEQLTAIVAPDDATDKSVSWTSSAPAVAAVDSDGNVTALSVGTAVITVTTTDGSKTASCTVTVTDPAVPVTGVTLNKTELTLTVGGAEQLSAAVVPGDADNQNVAWTSSNSAIASVDASGNVTAVSAGTAVITVTTEEGGKTAACTVTVTDQVIPVTGVTLDKNELTLAIGGSGVLSAAVVPGNATNQNVTWSSSDSAIAAVDASGNVTAVSVGTAVITVTTEEGGKTAECTITVTDPAVPVTGVTLNKTELALTVGDSEQLSAAVVPNDADNQNIIWTSSDSAIAAVDAGGNVTAVSAGTAVITVTTEEGGKTAACTVTVTDPVISVTGVTLNRNSLTLAIGGSGVLSAAVVPSNATNQNVTWSSSDSAVVAVGADGTLTAVSVGTAVITVTTEDGGKTAECTITVTDPAVPVTGVTLNKSSLTLTVGGAEQLSAAVVPGDADNQNIIWTSSDSAIASVDASGNVTAVSAGTAVITVATEEGGKTAACTVTVTEPVVPVTGVTLNKSSLTLTVGGSAVLKAAVVPSNATNKRVTWTSSNSAVASVDASGKVTAVRAGTATITVTAEGGKTAVCTVTVRASGGGSGSGGGSSSGGSGGGSSSGSSGSGSSSSTGEKSLPVHTTNQDSAADTTTTTATPSASTQGGTASAAVDNDVAVEIVKQAKEHESEVVVIAPDMDKGATKTEVSIPSSALQELGGETGASVIVSTPVASVTIPNGGLDSLSSGNGTVTVAAEKVDNTVELSLTVDGAPVASIPGGVALTVPVSNPTPGTVAVLVHEDGTREVIRKSKTGQNSITAPLSGSAKLEIVDNSKQFDDVTASNWYAGAAAFVSSRELLQGVSETKFAPAEPMTRGMMATVLYRLENTPKTDGQKVFDDVATGQWYTPAITWAAANGIVSGYRNGLFGPNDNVTREQLVTMLWRYAGSPEAASKELPFTDADRASSYARDALCWAAENGILTGYSNGQSDPKGLATRAQVAQMLKNFIENET